MNTSLTSFSSANSPCPKAAEIACLFEDIQIVTLPNGSEIHIWTCGHGTPVSVVVAVAGH